MGGWAAALAEVARRSGGHLDPDLAAAFGRHADEVLAALAEPDLLGVVIAAEPGAPVTVAADQLDELCQTLSIVADLKSLFMLGHSPQVAALADGAAVLSGLADG